jgi:collagenase-like PrtC family protease
VGIELAGIGVVPPMASLQFSAPYNEDPESLQELFKLKQLGHNSIREVYLSGPQEYSASGRVMDKLGLDAFLETVGKIHSEGLKVNLILNPTCDGAEWYSSATLNKTLDYLRLVHQEHGVESVTIANPLYVEAVRECLPDITICASVLGDIDCLEKAVVYAKLGANVITPDPSINRNLELLKEIKQATGAELKLMVNEGCLNKCAFRKFHFNYISHVSKESGREQIFIPYCDRVISDDPSQILKSGWIRPEDLQKYGEVATYFKIVGRELKKGKFVRAIRAYLEESWDGDLMDITCSSLGSYALRHGLYVDNKTLGELEFFERVTSCGQSCSRCGFCEELAEKLIEVGGFTEEKMEDKGLTGRIEYLRDEGLIT